jgi:hypothetical protein
MESVDTAVVDAAPAVTPQILGGEAQKLGSMKEQYRSPLSGAVLKPGRVKGTPNKVTRTIREAVELACQPGACHPKGLAGWLIERAKSRSAADRQIFAGLVGKALPLQVHAQHSGGIAIQLGWLQSRGIGATQADPAGSVTLEAREIDGQVVLEPAQLGAAQPEGQGMSGA